MYKHFQIPNICDKILPLYMRLRLRNSRLKIGEFCLSPSGCNLIIQMVCFRKFEYGPYHTPPLQISVEKIFILVWKNVSRNTKGIFEEKGKCKSTDKLRRTTGTRPKRQKHNTKNLKKQMNNMDPTKKLRVDSGAPEE